MAALLLCLTSLATAQPAPAWDALFQQRDGWIGADGANSVALAPQRVAWLFSDTWVGKIQDGKRTDATIVNNTLALQDGLDPATAKIEFIIRRDSAGKAGAFLKPDDGRGWFWLHAGVMVKDKLYLFLLQIEKTADPGVFGFKQIGEWLAVVSNPQEHPLRWQMRQMKLPFAVFTEQRHVSFGAAALVQGKELFVFGNLNDRPKDTAKTALVVAKVSLDDITNFAAWRFYGRGQWHQDTSHLEPLVPNIAAEFSVHRQADNQYVLISTEGGLSPRILRRTARSPEGPWSAAEVIYTCPEMQRDRNLFTYAAKAHPEISLKDGLLVTYVVNSLDFWQVARDATLYWPRFLLVPAR
jgi:hypothetical protein